MELRTATQSPEISCEPCPSIDSTHFCAFYESGVHGYAKLADLVGHDGDFAIFRRFAALNAKNLLYLQAEIVNLENDLILLERENEESGDMDLLEHQIWVAKLMAAPEGQNQQWKKVLEIREKLNEYSG